MSTAATLAGGETLEMRFDATVPRQLVHKAAVAEVLVTDFRPLGETEFACGCQAPRVHAYFNDLIAPFHDPLMLLEAGRQSFVVAAHKLMRVPDTVQFMFGDLDMRVSDVTAAQIAPEPAQLVWRSSFADPQFVRDKLVKLRLGGSLFVNGRHCLEVEGAGGFLDPRTYRLLRARKQDLPYEPPRDLPRLHPEAVGRRDSRNVVIAQPVPDVATETPSPCLSADVLVDTTHASFFDHPLDHVPGMLLVEAFRQTAITAAHEVHGLPAASAVVAGCQLRYRRYAELDSRLRCEATVAAPDSVEDGTEVAVELALVQFGEAIGTGRMTLRYKPGL